MTTVTIDISDQNADKVIADLKKIGVNIRESSFEDLNKLSVEDYHKHFAYQSEQRRERLHFLFQNNGNTGTSTERFK